MQSGSAPVISDDSARARCFALAVTFHPRYGWRLIDTRMHWGLPVESLFLAEMTWPEAKDALARARVAIIPVGSTEQHGPGMTLSTDITMATAVAGMVAERLRPRAIVAPSLPFGLSSHHMRFAGTISLEPETFSAVLMDVMRSLHHHGLNRFLLLNGHGGNQAILSLITMQARQKLGVEVATALYVYAASDLLMERYGRTWAHGCELEASLALAAAPELVRAEAVEKGAMVPPRYRHTALSGEGAPAGAFVDYAQRTDELTTNGAVGDPRLASREVGAEAVDLAVQRLVEFLEDFIASGNDADRPVSSNG